MNTKNVPVEPTEAMIEAGFPHIDSAYRRSSAEECYAAMIAAAPSPDGDPVYFVKPLQYSLTDGPWVKTNETAYNLFHIEPVRRMKLYTSPRVVDELAFLLNSIDAYLKHGGFTKSPVLAFAMNKAKAALGEGK